MPQTFCFAEIQALKYALTSIRNHLSSGNSYSNICIRTSSAYLTSMMRGDLRTCVQNGWRLGDGTYLEHAESWECINDVLRDLESVHGRQTNFCIEHVSGRVNLGASGLAYRTIDAHNLVEEAQNYAH